MAFNTHSSLILALEGAWMLITADVALGKDPQGPQA
jgi:hypothetical protein